MIKNLIFLLPFFAFTLYSAVNSQSKDDKDNIRIIYAEKIDEKISVDGNLSEESWNKTVHQSDFIQLEPALGNISSEKTEVMILYDDENLYVGFKCFTSSPSDIVASITRRDHISKNDDHVSIILDTFLDLRSGYYFCINPLSTQVDAKLSNDGSRTDNTWDSGWIAKAIIQDWGWSAEFSIPLKILRFNAKENMTWGINFGRFIAKNLEMSYWSGRMREDFRVSQGGILTGLNIKTIKKDIHFIPYNTSRYDKITSENIKGKWNEEFGLDVEYNPITNLTSNFTLNPDFASVEGDQEQINLTRFEISFPEKRRFFIEGSELFRTRIPVFYPRRISEIKFGNKIIGKKGNYNFAFGNFQAEKVEDAPIAFKSSESNITVTRLQRDILESSTIGLIGVNKMWSGGYNRVLSLDATLNLPHNLYGTAQFVGSWPGSFIKGLGFFLRLEKRTNTYNYHLRYTNLGKEFKTRVNPVGFIQDDNRHEFDSSGRYKFWVKRKGLEFINWNSNYNIYWNHDKVFKSADIWETLQFYFSNKISIQGYYQYEYKLYEKGFYNNVKRITLGYKTEEWTSKTIEYSWGRNYYNDFKLYSASINTKPNQKFSFEYSLKKIKFYPDIEDKSTFINILTFNYQFTPDLFLRIFTQNNTVNNRYYLYSIFGFRFRPPYSAFYIVFTNDEFDSRVYTKEINRILFFKFSHSIDF